MFKVEGGRARGGVVVEKAPLAGFGLSCLLRHNSTAVVILSHAIWQRVDANASSISSHHLHSIDK
jgi:hypothetical protein